MDFENYSITELKQLRKDIDNILSNREKMAVKEKMEKVRNALQDLYNVAPYAFFTDSYETQFDIKDILRLSEISLGISVPMHLS